MVFWLTAAAMVAMVGALIARALWRSGQEGAPSGDVREQDLKVYRDQLREVERDAGRGIIGGDEAERLRAEVARRILALERSGAPAPDAAVPGQAGGGGRRLA
ncbi:c-type cytochrome biogenesis protein CcmI, partial [Rhodobacteraceae bacterium WD3A24]